MFLRIAIAMDVATLSHKRNDPAKRRRRGRLERIECGLRAILLRRLFGYRPTNVNEIVGDDTKPDPTLHSTFALVAATREPMSPLGYADAPLTSGAPFLAVAEPALLLLASALGTLGGAVGDADALDAFGSCRSLVLAGIERGICRQQVWGAADRRLMRIDCRHQQV